MAKRWTWIKPTIYTGSPSRALVRSNTAMQNSIFTTKTESLYFACSPERDVVSYGGCQDEALNNLQDELQIREQAARGKRHAH
jgi:hypothetical protein